MPIKIRACYILRTYNTQIDCRIKSAVKSQCLVVADYDRDVCLRLGKNFSTNLFKNRLPLLIEGTPGLCALWKIPEQNP